jgi:hypothetical protein
MSTFDGAHKKWGWDRESAAAQLLHTDMLSDMFWSWRSKLQSLFLPSRQVNVAASHHCEAAARCFRTTAFFDSTGCRRKAPEVDFGMASTSLASSKMRACARSSTTAFCFRFRHFLVLVEIDSDICFVLTHKIWTRKPMNEKSLLIWAT